MLRKTLTVFSLIGLLLSVGLWGASFGCQSPSRRTAWGDEFVEICAWSLRGRSPWELRIDADGSATLTVRGKAPHTYTLTQSQLNQITSALHKSAFASLDAQYGGRVPDGTSEKIRVVTRTYEKEVVVNFLPNLFDADKLQGAGRFLRLWFALRNTFDDPDARDKRKYLRRFLPES